MPVRQVSYDATLASVDEKKVQYGGEEDDATLP